ncbi:MULTISPECIES: XkdX family protein [Liquorilactobacillus]
MSVDFVRENYVNGKFTQANLQLFVKIGWLKQDDYNSIVVPAS